MYHKAYGIIETLAPLHIGASAGEETGNLNLIFRDQFTQTGIIPGSSIRGRFRADMRSSQAGQENTWYGHEAIKDADNNTLTSEALVKFEYASLVWLPVFCPGQPVVWVSCPRLLKRYKLIAPRLATVEVPSAYTAAKSLKGRTVEGTTKKMLFFNLGFLEVEHLVETNVMGEWIPEGVDLQPENLVIVGDDDISMLHDMALYRQSRVKLGSRENPNEKKVDGGAFFNVEALPEGSVLAFPVALKQTGWKPFGDESSQDLYFGGLESIGFGHCRVTLAGEY
jgi:CRISPR-associated protein Cmr4